MAHFKSHLIRTHSHSGKAHIDVYVIVDAKDLAGVFFGSWNHIPDEMNLYLNERRLQDVIGCSSVAGCTAWTQFNSRFKYLQNVDRRGGGGNHINWIDFSYRIPDRFPYRVYYPIPSQLDSHHGHGTWKSYCIELENHLTRREDGTHALATLSIQRSPHADKQLLYTADIWAWSHKNEVVEEREEFLTRLTRRFEIHFWTLTGNHWHEYPHRFKPVIGLYRPRESQVPVEVAAQHPESKRVRSRSQSPVRKGRV